MKRTATAVLIIFIGLAAGACAGKKAEVAPASPALSTDEALFNEGQKAVKKDPEKARLYYRQVIDSFPKSFYAQRAKLAIADSYFNEGDEGNLILASSEYRTFISENPLSPSTPYAQYRIALCFYNKILSPGRDQQKTIQALAEFRKTIAVYPLSDEAKLAREKIKDCEEHLAESTFLIGLQYYRTEAYNAAINRLKEVLTNYPSYSGLDKIYFYLGDSNFNMKLIEQSTPFFTKLVTDYPKSKFAVKAQDRLKEIEAIKPKPKK